MNRETAVASPGDAARNQYTWLALILLGLLALGLRSWGLDAGMWYDEIRTLLVSVRSPSSTIVTVFPSNNQHTLYSLLAHVSIATFGEHAWSLRLPAMLLGTATVPMLYFCAREFASREEALMASLLLTVDYYHVWFSQNARGYSALSFFALLTTFLLLRGLRRRERSDFIWYAVAAALGVYMHLTMVFLVVAHAILCLLPLGHPHLNRATGDWWRLPALGFVMAGLLSVVFYAPVLLEVQQFFVDRPSPMLVATPRWAALELIRGLNIGIGTGIWALARVGLLAVGLWSYFRQSRFVTGLFVLPGVVTVAAAVALQRPIFPRFLFFLIGFAMLALVRGAVELGRWVSRSGAAGQASPVSRALVAGLAAISLATLVPNYKYPKQDFDGALRFVETSHSPDEPIATVGLTRIVYGEYYMRPWIILRSADDLREVRAGGRRVWVLRTLDGYIRSTLPDVMRVLEEECAVVAVFKGTLRNGDVTVCRINPL
jgi:uncharacterized membrane protein